MTNNQHGQVPEALTYERDRAIMEGERNASLDAYSRLVLLTSAESRLYEAAFTNGWDRCTTHVQNPAEIEHVAGDVSKNGAEANMTQQPAPAGATEEVENLRKALVYVAFALHDTPQYMLAQGIALIDGDTVRVSRDGWTVEASVSPHRQPAPATQQVGERVYAFRRKGLADFCTCDEARYEELSNKPHLFETRIFYTAPQPSPTAQAADSVPAPVQSGLVATMLDALRHAQKVLNHNNLHMECGPVNAAILAACATADSVLEDAARLDFLIEQRAYVVSDPDTCPGYWLHFVHKETGKCWVQSDEHPTPRAAIDAAMNKGGAT